MQTRVASDGPCCQPYIPFPCARTVGLRSPSLFLFPSHTHTYIHTLWHSCQLHISLFCTHTVTCMALPVFLLSDMALDRPHYRDIVPCVTHRHHTWFHPHSGICRWCACFLGARLAHAFSSFAGSFLAFFYFSGMLLWVFLPSISTFGGWCNDRLLEAGGMGWNVASFLEITLLSAL